MASRNHKEYFLNLSNFTLVSWSASWKWLLFTQFIAESFWIEHAAVIFNGFGSNGVPSGKGAKIEVAVDLLSDEILAVKIGANDYVSELHAIACQCASLISENVLDLSQLLINTHRMAFSFTIVNPTIHFLVSFHENSLEHLDKLQWNNQGNGYECVVKNVIWA